MKTIIFLIDVGIQSYKYNMILDQSMKSCRIMLQRKGTFIKKLIFLKKKSQFFNHFILKFPLLNHFILFSTTPLYINFIIKRHFSLLVTFFTHVGLFSKVEYISVNYPTPPANWMVDLCKYFICTSLI